MDIQIDRIESNGWALLLTDFRHKFEDIEVNDYKKSIIVNAKDMIWSLFSTFHMMQLFSSPTILYQP